MSGRGGRNGSSSSGYPASSHQRGGGGGGGRGRGRSTTGGGGVNTRMSSTSTSSSSVYEIGESSSSTAAVALSHEVERRLTLQETAPSTVVPAAAAAMMVVTTAAPSPASSKKVVKFPMRPGFGKAGDRCVVKANHFLVQLSDKDLHHYDVSISPEVTSKGVNRAVISQLVKTYGESHLRACQPAYDGKKSLYTPGPLPFSSKEFVINLCNKDGSRSTRQNREFKVVIKFASKANLHHLQQFLCSRQRDAPQEVIQFLDIVMRETPSQRYTIVGSSFFSKDFGQPKPLGGGVECWRGYYQSLRPTQMGMSLNIDVSATSFYQPIKVIDFVIMLLNLRDASVPLSDTNRVKVKKALRGVRVELTHIEGKSHPRISGITSQSTSQLKFPVDDKGTTVSVVQYYKEKYNIQLKHVNWPSLQAGSDSRPIYLPMEVCKIVEGQRYSKKLNDKQVSAILKASCQRPHEREANVSKMVGHNGYSEDKYAKEFGIKVQDRLTSIDGARVLKPPVLKYHDTGRDVKLTPRIGQWNMINAKLVNGGRVDHWACVNFSRLHQDRAKTFFQQLVAMCSSKGMAFNPTPLFMKTAPSNLIEKTLFDIYTESSERLATMRANGKQLQLLIIILPDSSGSYGKIKRICETELGIMSQCCQPKNAEKLNNQYMENVSLKINVKVGGRNTVLVDALLRRIPLVSDAPTIIFGADVTHPQPGEDSSPSIAAVVASMDWPEVTKYKCLVSAQKHRQEIIEDLYKVTEDPQMGRVNGGMIRELLISFKRSTGHKPHRIIFYRDGVSEGQFSQVLLSELEAIRKACASLEEGYLPPVTFVVVQKRHHTRLFPANHNDRGMTDKSGNILPGTVVDTMICHPTEFDFYLCSHAGIQGTSRPTHYHVLWDENKFTADALQTLTNNLCYTYARCTRSVSIVPPAYYAHLGAFRARYYIEGDMSDSGSSTAGGGGGRNTREKTDAVRSLPKIKDCVKEFMFYC